jgi:hypothetical protein
VGHKEGTEAAIQARLRELTTEARRLRAELSEKGRAPGRDRSIARMHEKPRKTRRGSGEHK